MLKKLIILSVLLAVISCKKDNTTPPAPEQFKVVQVEMNGEQGTNSFSNISFPVFSKITFSAPVDTTTIRNAIFFTSKEGISIPTKITVTMGDTIINVQTLNPLNSFSTYYLSIRNNLTSKKGTQMPVDYVITLQSTLDTSDKFPRISDDQLLQLIQEKTFRYFYDFAQTSSGMARERNTSDDLVTTGGSGFGLMALVVGMDRNFISRNDGLTRLSKIISFLETCDRYHGVWPHWINGVTGKTIPFGTKDNGADLVETSFIVEGLITVRQYLKSDLPEEKSLINRINTLVNAVEYDWFTRGGQNVLYWHWSPNYGWDMNMPVRGYNEALIVYVAAASSATHSITKLVYDAGWAGNGSIRNNKIFYGYKLPVGYDYGGPLFFAHYSFMGLNPQNLKDTYADYWQQNVNHTLINYSYCVANPKNFAGYSADCWGLTASDNPWGYSAHSPTNDKGVISPTAAISSLPYAPEQSMKAIRYFYYKLGDKLWGNYGFYDSFCLKDGWFASSYLAIDQGPQIVMIENYRTGLLWNLFMSAPEVKTGLTKLGFTY